MNIMHKISAVLVAAVLSLSATFAHAGEDPPGCNATATGIAIEALLDGSPTLGPVVEGQIIFYRVTLFNTAANGCNFFGGQISNTRADGVTVQIAGFGGPTPDVPVIPFGMPFEAVSMVPYLVSSADAVGGVITARTDYGQTLNQPGQINGTFETDPQQMTASATTSLPLTIVVPSISIDKSADITTVCAGSATPVTYTYTVTNTGTVALENVVVTDDTAPCNNPAFAGGDLNGNTILDLVEIWTYTCVAPISMNTTNTATVNATDVIGGIAVMDTAMATVTALPAPDCTITADPVCADSVGNMASVADAGPGAVYLWSIDDGMITAGQGTPNITYSVGAGPTTLTVTITLATNCECTDMFNVVFLPDPNCTITADPPCALTSGNMASVADAGAGATYLWGIAGGVIDVGQGTPMISYTAGAGPNVTLTIDITDGNGCSCTDTLILPVNAAPCTIDGPAGPLCGGTTGHVYCGPNFQAAYAWSIAGNGVIVGPNNGTCVTVTAGAAGSFTLTLTVTDFNGCMNTCDVMVDVVGGGSVGDFIWEDLNNDGLQDFGEPGIPNVTVTLFRKDGMGGLDLVSVTATDGLGIYGFDGLCADDYRLVITPPAGFTETIPNVGGDDTIDSDCIAGVIQFTLPTDATVDLTHDCGFTQVTEERPHPGWNWVDNVITLTHNEPTYWSALTGQPKGVAPFTILDPSPNPVMQGRPAMDGTNDRVLRGYVYAWAVDAQEREIGWNHLKGDAVLINYRDGTAWEYNAWAFQTVDVAHGGLGLAPFGQLDLNGAEYVRAYDQLLLDFYAVGSEAFSGGNPFQLLSVNTDLTLHPVGADLRQENHGPLTTKATFVVWNENETQFTGLHRCITCWDQTLLSLYTDAQNHFLVGNLQTDKGKARIDGLQSTFCSSNCCIPRPAMNPNNHPGCDNGDCQELVCAVDSSCCTVQWDAECVWIAVDLCAVCDGINDDAALLGVAAKQITVNGAQLVSAAGLNLIGMGTQTAQIRHDLGGGAPPPPVTTPDALLEEFFGTALPGGVSGAPSSELLGRESRGDDADAPAPTLQVGPGIADRVSGTEKGSLLIFSKVEIRWDAVGNVVQDTFLDMCNDWPADVNVKLYFINGDPPLEAMVFGP